MGGGGGGVQLFSVPAFFILFRETLEASIILSVMLTLLNKLVAARGARARMRRQVWAGVGAGVLLSLGAAAVFLSLYYTVAKRAWEQSEALWEGVLGLVAVALITLMAFSMLRVETWREKWERKLTKVTVEAVVGAGGGAGGGAGAGAAAMAMAEEEAEQQQQQQQQSKEEEEKKSKSRSSSRRYALFLIPFTVVLREGVEAVIFLGGIGLQGSATAYPIAAAAGALCGAAVGYALYRGGNRAAFRAFLTAATLLLLVIAAGLFAGSVHELEEYTRRERFLWQLACCDPEQNNVWSLLNALVGWRNEATVGTLSAYLAYWAAAAAAFLLLRLKWRRDAARLLRLEQAAAANGHGAAHLQQPPPPEAISLSVL